MTADHQTTGDSEASGPMRQAVAAAVAGAMAGLLDRPLAPGLYLVATPIGHLGDLSLRAVATLAGSDRIYCEDTRHSVRLLTHYAIRRPLTPYHEHNADSMRPRVLEDLAAGKRVALISDAGTPLVSDPGYKLVRDAVAAGHQVTAVPGASAVLAALSVAGLPTDAFLFAGFLSPKSGRRRERLEALLREKATLVIFEAPSRLSDTLAEIAAIDGKRSIAVARELTKLHETVLRGSALDVSHQVDGAVKGECVIIVAPAQDETIAVDDAQVRHALQIAMTAAPLNAAVRSVTEQFGLPRKQVYDMALALKGAS